MCVVDRASLDWFEAVTTTCWWRGGRFAVWNTRPGQVFIAYDHTCDVGKSYDWFAKQPEMNQSGKLELDGWVEIIEIYNVKEAVRQLPLGLSS
ncbi:hypothetical protein GCM10027344_23090 [Spelaeicoccus albus]|uniref:Uncharacterized protein n=1 Tax=Spelaeicoccus albus TaxID=1280376 RepID=A0A7Z0A9D8_9MICO|nr:hypothetical protein [Spelaeicoccus albus]